MKKIVFVLIAVMGFCFSMNAQDGSASCKLPGTYDYVSVDFYKGKSQGMGNLTYSVQSNDISTLNEVKVVVKADIMTEKARKEEAGYKEDEYGRLIRQYKEVPAVWKHKVLFDGKLRDIPVNRTNKIDVEMPFYHEIKNISVSVSNPICK